MTKLIYCVIYIYTFEQQCVVLTVMLQSPHLKDHMKTIGIDQLLSHGALFEHTCLQNIKILYKHAGKCDGQQKLKYTLDEAIVFTTKGFTDKIPRSPITPTPVNNPSARKPLCLFTNMLDVKNKTATRQVRYAKSKRKATKSGSKPWSLKREQKESTKINDLVNKSIYN